MGLHYDSISPVDRLNAAVTDLSMHSTLSSHIDKGSSSINGNYITYDASSFANSISKHGLKIGCLNIRRLLCKIYEIRELLIRTKLDLVCLCETFIDYNVADDETSIQGYSVALRNRHGVGVHEP